MIASVFRKHLQFFISYGIMVPKGCDFVAYSRSEQETMVHFDVETRKTIFYSNYAPDIRKYLAIEKLGESSST